MQFFRIQGSNEGHSLEHKVLMNGPNDNSAASCIALFTLPQTIAVTVLGTLEARILKENYKMQ